MDQIVGKPRASDSPDIEAELMLAGKSGRRGRSWLVLCGLAALAAFGIGAAYFWSSGSSSATTYLTTPAEVGSLTVSVSATGALQPLTQVDISSELSGIVRTVSVDENQQVRKGEVLAELDTVRLLAQLDRAKASAAAADAKVADARTTLTETEQTLERSQQLAKRGTLATQSLETATAARDRAASALAVAEANLKIAVADVKLQQTDVDKSTIYAPIDGIVLTRSVDPGQTVASSLQAPVLFVIAADLRKMELKAAIDEADIGAVQPGQHAEFTVDAYPDRRFDAEIRDIAYASVTTEGVVTYDARLDVENPDLLLRPGMTATVTVVTRHAENVVTVPSAAFRYVPSTGENARRFSLSDLFSPPRPPFRSTPRKAAAEPGMRTLYVLKDGAPIAAQVKTGANDGERTEILSGLAAGDLVVTGQRETSR
ncbi:MAG: efflux RND transporter periplasmic adaptor subunit [Rhizobiaceae bacterium]|nr:efflux RND transporter periplasmic adaptor subunit [Rhizobiaceae bacterium]